jgi:hypothetical protein
MRRLSLEGTRLEGHTASNAADCEKPPVCHSGSGLHNAQRIRYRSSFCGETWIAVVHQWILRAGLLSLRMATTSQIWLRASQSWPFAPVSVASA